MDKRLYKSRTEKMIDGVCGGIAEYVNLDPTVVRVLFALISAFTGGIPGIIVYIVLSIVMPIEPYVQ